MSYVRNVFNLAEVPWFFILIFIEITRFNIGDYYTLKKYTTINKPLCLTDCSYYFDHFTAISTMYINIFL